MEQLCGTANGDTHRITAFLDIIVSWLHLQFLKYLNSRAIVWAVSLLHFQAQNEKFLESHTNSCLVTNCQSSICIQLTIRSVILDCFAAKHESIQGNGFKLCP